MPSLMHKALKMTTTETFRVRNPDKPNTSAKFPNIERNRAVLDKMLP